MISPHNAKHARICQFVSGRARVNMNRRPDSSRRVSNKVCQKKESEIANGSTFNSL